MSPVKRIALTVGVALVLVSAACTSPPPVDPEPPDPPPTVDVSVGRDHSCAVRDDGTVHCWGRNHAGQLGDGTTTDRAAPVQVAGVYGAVSVSAGGFHTCAVLSDGFSQCWGSGGGGQLGNGSGNNSLVPVSPRGLIDVVEITTGDAHSCARTIDGAVWCWGSRSLGRGSDPRSSYSPVLVELPTAVDIDAGTDHTCAVLADTTVRCWGEDNTQGQLGDGTTSTTRLPVVVSGLAGATTVSAGENHSCATLSDGTVRCWGLDGGRLGSTSAVGFSPVPVPVDGVAGAASVAAGREETCARRANGSLQCWGLEAVDPGAVGSTHDVELSTGGHGCAVLTDGSVRCWGSRSYGQLGNDDADAASASPVSVGPLEPAAAVSAGGTFGCALLPSTTLRCWGLNDSLQLGNIRVGNSPSPVPVLHYTPGAPSDDRRELRHVVELETGSAHACTRLSGGMMRCWGNNNSGQIGIGSTGSAREPVGPSGIYSAVDISAGGANSCAVLDDGTARCWGFGGWRIGSGTMPFTSAPSPLTVAGLIDATSIDTGQNHTCVVRTGGKVSCWGADDGNQGVLGQSVFLGSNVPLEIADLDGVVEVAAGGRHSCALLADGSVRCWGANDRGQLGDGSSTAKSFEPVPVVGLQDAVAITAGGEHSCALLADGTARCWGANAYGQLGDGSRQLSRSPVEVAGLSGLTDVDGGDRSTCAATSDGSAWCWGANSSRQLGTGASFTSPPVQVVGFP